MPRVRPARPKVRRRRSGRGAVVMIAVTHFADPSADFADRAQAALSALAARPGYVRGTLGRSPDAPAAWLLLTEGENLGSYRRALGGYDVKMHATPLLASAL